MILRTRPQTFGRVFKRYAHGSADVLGTLNARNLIRQTSRNDSDKSGLYNRTVYVGIDPSADALHIGHLLPLMSLLHFQLSGHTPIALIGGATGLVGDPSGRAEQRPDQAALTVEKNVEGLTAGIAKFFSSAIEHATESSDSHEVKQSVRLLNNLEWTKPLTLLQFLDVAGKHVRMSRMLSRDSVKLRLNSSDGMAFSEFTYQLLQAYDFLHLYNNHNCSIQIGGSDQWGNITAGLDLINGASQANKGIPASNCLGITTPLLTTASGEKLGKSAGNAIWLDTKKTSVFDFYQFFIRVTDEDVQRFLLQLTLIPVPEVEAIMQRHLDNPDKRFAQTTLAEHVTKMIHGPIAVTHAKRITDILFQDGIAPYTTQQIIEAFQDDPRLQFCNKEYLLSTPLVQILAESGLASSRGAARTLISQGGFYLNNKCITDIHRRIQEVDCHESRVVALRAGKHNYKILVAR